MQCPKCGKPMLDVRAQKQNPKAPDFQCPDANCLNDKGYRTGAWLPKPKGVSPGYPPAPIVRPEAPQPQAGPSTTDSATADVFWASFDNVLEGLKARKLTDLFKGEDIVKLVATQFIGRRG